MTSGAALAGAAAMLGTRLDAELLLAHVLDVSRSSVIARDDRVLTPEEQGALASLVARRVAGEPLAYLTGVKEFWSLELEVTKDVLVPRPETELLVEWGAALGGAAIADLGTGSGALALALARERPAARVTGVDRSRAALAVARRNAAALRLGNVEFVEGSWWQPLAGRRFDLVVSNPPYVAEGDPHLADLKFEPPLSLTAGPDGLEALRAIVAGAPAHLNTGGSLLVEHGTAQGAAVRELFARAGLEKVETRRDLAGHERATGGRHP